MSEAMPLNPNAASFSPLGVVVPTTVPKDIANDLNVYQTLPIDVWQIISKTLTVKEVCSCRLVCRFWRNTFAAAIDTVLLNLDVNPHPSRIFPNKDIRVKTPAHNALSRTFSKATNLVLKVDAAEDDDDATLQFMYDQLHKIGSFPQLRSLSLQAPHNSPMVVALQPLQRLKSLRHLEVSCTHLPEELITWAAAQGPSLTALKVQSNETCHHLTYRNFHLHTLAQALPALQSLELVINRRFTDSGMAALSLLTRLTQLVLVAARIPASNITPHGLVSPVTVLTRLKTLHVGSFMISEEFDFVDWARGWGEILGALLELKELRVAVPGLSDEMLSSFLLRSPSLAMLEIRVTGGNEGLLTDQPMLLCEGLDGLGLGVMGLAGDSILHEVGTGGGFTGGLELLNPADDSHQQQLLPPPPPQQQRVPLNLLQPNNLPAAATAALCSASDSTSKCAAAAGAVGAAVAALDMINSHSHSHNPSHSNGDGNSHPNSATNSHPNSATNSDDNNQASSHSHSHSNSSPPHEAAAIFQSQGTEGSSLHKVGSAHEVDRVHEVRHTPLEISLGIGVKFSSLLALSNLMSLPGLTSVVLEHVVCLDDELIDMVCEAVHLTRLELRQVDNIDPHLYKHPETLHHLSSLSSLQHFHLALHSPLFHTLTRRHQYLLTDSLLSTLTPSWTHLQTFHFAYRTFTPHTCHQLHTNRMQHYHPSFMLTEAGVQSLLSLPSLSSVHIRVPACILGRMLLPPLPPPSHLQSLHLLLEYCPVRTKTASIGMAWDTFASVLLPPSLTALHLAVPGIDDQAVAELVKRLPLLTDLGLYNIDAGRSISAHAVHAVLCKHRQYAGTVKGAEGVDGGEACGGGKRQLQSLTLRGGGSWWIATWIHTGGRV